MINLINKKGRCTIPTHDYKCSTCEHEFEIFYKTQSERDEEEQFQTCPECGSPVIERLISKGTSFILKGRGWERDGYNG